MPDSSSIQTCSTRRLYDLLIELRGLNVPLDQNNRVFEVLPRTMGIADADVNRQAIRSLTLLGELFTSVEHEIDFCFPSAHMRLFHKRPLTGLASAFSPLHLHAFWAQQKAALRAEDVTGLEYTAMAVEGLHPQTRLDDAVLKSAIDLIEEAEIQLLASGISGDARHLLNKSLRGVRDALTSYKVGGLDALIEALMYFTGSFAFHSKQVAKQGGPDIAKTLWSVLATVSDLITVAQATWVGYHALLPVQSQMHALLLT